jgi:hypothetical protein
MRALLLSIAHLLLAIGFLELGSGLQGVLIPVRAQAEGFSTQLVGLPGTVLPLDPRSDGEAGREPGAVARKAG